MGIKERSNFTHDQGEVISTSYEALRRLLNHYDCSFSYSTYEKLKGQGRTEEFAFDVYTIHANVKQFKRQAKLFLASGMTLLNEARGSEKPLFNQVPGYIHMAQYEVYARVVKEGEHMLKVLAEYGSLRESNNS